METTKFYYSYNDEFNAFSGKFPAIKNPRRENEYLLPYKATFKEPPEVSGNEITVWEDDHWNIVSDFRGKTQINIESREVSKIDYIGAIKQGFQLVTDEMALDINRNPDKYKIIDNQLVNISDTEEYREILQAKEVQRRIETIKKELEELDTKRIRAVCEPSIKDETTGETWLDYYNNQASILREELQTIQGN